MGEVQKRGLLYELKGGYRIDMTEEEYREKREELGQIAARLHVNLDVLDLLEKDYRMRLIVLSLASYFGFEKITGGKLLKAACLEPKEGVNDIKAFFHKAGWMPYYLENMRLMTV
jgi:hypothetical protein